MVGGNQDVSKQTGHSIQFPKAHRQKVLSLVELGLRSYKNLDISQTQMSGTQTPCFPLHACSGPGAQQPLVSHRNPNVTSQHRCGQPEARVP